MNSEIKNQFTKSPVTISTDDLFKNQYDMETLEYNMIEGNLFLLIIFKDDKWQMTNFCFIEFCHFVICHFSKIRDFEKVVGINRVGWIYNTESYILSKTVIFNNPNAR